MPDGPSNILLIENNFQEARLVLESLKETKYEYNIHTVQYGWDAIKFLKLQEKLPEKPDTDLILLDLGLNDVNGFEVLKMVKNSPVLKTIPVVVFTNSRDPEDEVVARKYNAGKYIIKPFDIGECINDLNEVLGFCKFKMK